MTQMDVLANTMLRIKAEYLWEAAAICRKQMDPNMDYIWNDACEACEAALQKLSRELDPNVDK